MARIKIDIDRKIGAIDRRIYGNFAEHLGRCIYGGIYEPGSSLADADGFRTDVLEALKGLRIPLLRWPGGNFVSGYHWENGVGPRKSRPKKMEWAWNTTEDNSFGTDEFVKFCKAMGTEPYICVNLGNGTPEEAAHWVEYCNGSKDTHYADMRRKNGNSQTYGVKYWGLGNEIYGRWQIGYKSATDYAKVALEAAKMMKWTDPDISLIACGADVNWNIEVLRYLYDIVDCLSVHIYVGGTGYYDVIANSVTQLDRLLTLTNDAIDIVQAETKAAKRVHIALDEWNVWYNAGVDIGLEQVYDLKDALIIGAFLNTFHKYCATLKIADLAQLVNVIAPILTSKEGLVKQTIYYPLALAAQHSGNIALDALVESDTFDTKEHAGSFYLNASVTLDDPAKTLTVSVVNFSEDRDIETRIQTGETKPKGTGTAYEVNGADPKVTNTFAEPNRVGMTEKKLTGVTADWKYAFPKHSMTVLKLDI